MSSPASYLSRYVNNMQEAATLRMVRLAREVAAQGHDVVNLTIGEPDFVTPPHIREAAKAALDAGRTHYPPVPGIPELRAAICKKFERDNGISVKPDQIVVSTGAKQSLANACLALLDPGDEALLPTPFWVSYTGLIGLAGGVPVPIESSVDQDFKITPAQLKAAITPKTKLLMFSNPSNPAGAVYDRAELEAFAEVLEPHKRIFVISDEIYEYINFGGPLASIGSLPGLRDRTVTVNGFSKGYAMTGWRLGYMAAPPDIAVACAKIQGQFTSGACVFNQVAAVEALLGDQSATQEMRESFRRRRDLAVPLLRAIPGLKVSVPQGAFYLFPDVSAHFGKTAGNRKIADADDLCAYLLEDAHVATVSGAPFGDPRCIRLSIAAAEEKIERGIARIGAALGRLT